MKVAEHVCRSCGERPCDPAHVTPRSLGGCDAAECVIPLCRVCHWGLDENRMDVLPLLTREEQGHAAAHLGLIGALERSTGERWAPVGST